MSGNVPFGLAHRPSLSNNNVISPTSALQSSPPSSASFWTQKLRSQSPFGSAGGGSSKQHSVQQPMTKDEIVAYGKCLCGQYIRSRLRRAGCLTRRATQRLRLLPGESNAIPPPSDSTRDIFATLNAMGQELERMHPRIFSNVSRQLSRTPFGELADADAAPFLLHAIAKELFKAPSASVASPTPIGSSTPLINNNKPTAGLAVDVSWAKIVSLFAVCAALALDVVRQGHYDYLPRLLEGVGAIIEDDLAAWIQLQRGAHSPDDSDGDATGSVPGASGWSMLAEQYRPAHRRASRAAAKTVNLTDTLAGNWCSLAMAGVLSMYAVVWSMRWCAGFWWTSIGGWEPEPEL